MSRDIYDEAKRLLDHARKPQALEDAEQAVIKAAEALHGCRLGWGPTRSDLMERLFKAVEALKEARK